MKKRVMAIVMAVSASLYADGVPDSSAPKAVVQYSIIEQARPLPPVLRFHIWPVNVGKGPHTVNFVVAGMVNPNCSPDPKTGRRFAHDLINQPPPPCMGTCRKERPFKVKVLPLAEILTPTRPPLPTDANGGDPSTFVWLMPLAAINPVFGVKSRYCPTVTVQVDGKAAEIEFKRAAGPSHIEECP